jgi:hypothetical protein
MWNGYCPTGQRSPEAVGKDYLVLGTVDRKVWQQGLHGQGQPLADMLAHVADFKEVLELHVEPGGWRRADQ